MSIVPQLGRILRSFLDLIQSALSPPSSTSLPSQAPIEMTTPPQPTLRLQKHKSYWLRCLLTCLPSEYTSTDLTRTTLGYFSVAALDLLGELSKVTTEESRNGWVEWVYANQRTHGGFRGSPATKGVREEWDPANLPATLFAVITLLTLGDDLERLKKREILELLPRLQREDGSFGEWVQVSGEIVGGRDMRHIYIAVALRWLLRGKDGTAVGAKEVADFNVAKLVEYIVSSQTYDAGISDQPFGEAHAGMTYCAIAALSLLGCLDAINDPTGLLRWLVSRQVPFENHHGMAVEDYEYVQEAGSAEEKEEAHRVEIGADGHPMFGGFNGRCNKTPDTCYSFWVGASLDMLKKIHLLDINANRRFLLNKTQHVIGGFSKLPQPGGVPDILHSFLGLAALALIREEGINRLDPALCVSMQTKERLMAMDWWNGVMEGEVPAPEDS